jgi:CubicO group peptidase (beta-lactamase class C family)
VHPAPTRNFASEAERLVSSGLASHVYPGAVWAAGGVQGIYLTGSAGVLDPAGPAQPMTTATVFDMASLTKILAVWAAAGTLWDAGTIRLDDTLADLIPHRTRGYPLGQVTVRQLLTHTAGVPPRARLQELYGTDPDAIRDGVLHENLHRPPGLAVEYTDRAALILGYLIEELTGTTLSAYAREQVWEPLGMTSTHFAPLAKATARTCAPTEHDESAGRHLQGVPHDFSARLLGGTCGIAGTFSTLADSCRFLRHTLAPGKGQCFSDAWVTESLAVRTGALEPARGLFWHPAPGTSPADGVYAHYGFTGTAMWISRAQRRWAVLLTNKLYYSRDREPINAIRDQFRELIFATASQPAGPA